MHILLMGLKPQEYEWNGYGQRLVWTGSRSHQLWAEKPYGEGTYSSSSIGVGTLHACTSDTVEDVAGAAAGRRTKVKDGMPGGGRGLFSAVHGEPLLCEGGLLGHRLVLMAAEF